MPVNTVAIMSPGDMGHAVGKVLSESGLDVITCTEGRSLRTRNLAENAGFRQVASLSELASQADLILSIMVPSRAMDFAKKISLYMNSTTSPTFYADCNAVSPQTSQSISKVINNSGGVFIDGGIIGGAPTKGETPRFNVSGPDAAVVTELDGKGRTV